MRAAFVIARKDLRQRFRDRSAIVIGVVAPVVIAALMSRTGGNPFYTTELVRLLCSEHRHRALTASDVLTLDVTDAGAQALLDERMPEAETPAGAVRDQQPRGNGGLEIEQQILGVKAGDVLEQFRHEVPPGDARDRQQRLCVFRQPVHPAQQHVADSARHIECGHVRRGEPPVAMLAADEPDELCGVERVAAGPVHQGGDDVRLRRLSGQPLKKRRDVPG